jgi:hypothetical protein
VKSNDSFVASVSTCNRSVFVTSNEILNVHVSWYFTFVVNSF